MTKELRNEAQTAVPSDPEVVFGWQKSPCGHAIGSTLLVRSRICPKTPRLHKSTLLENEDVILG